MQLFYNIIIKSFPKLKPFLKLKEYRSYGFKCFDFLGKVQDIGGYYTYFELSFPQDYRDDILLVLKFCGIYVEKEEYDSLGMGYFTFRDV